MVSSPFLLAQHAPATHLLHNLDACVRRPRRRWRRALRARGRGRWRRRAATAAVLQLLHPRRRQPVGQRAPGREAAHKDVAPQHHGNLHGAPPLNHAPLKRLRRPGVRRCRGKHLLQRRRATAGAVGAATAMRRGRGGAGVRAGMVVLGAAAVPARAAHAFASGVVDVAHGV
jgi:hypothetical protein